MQSRGGLLVAAVTVALFGTLFAPAVAVADASDATEPTVPTVQEGSAFVVELEPDGDATVTLALAYDRSDGDEEAAFERVRDRSENVTARYAERLSRIADRTSTATGREMAVSRAEMNVSATGDVGVIRLSASWTNLAAVDGDRLLVSEPFASEFRPDRPFVLVAPEGYAIGDTSVDPDATTPVAETTPATAEWTAGTDLSGFSATLAPSDATGSVTDGSLPTPLVPTLALVSVGLLAYAGWRRT